MIVKGTPLVRRRSAGKGPRKRGGPAGDRRKEIRLSLTRYCSLSIISVHMQASSMGLQSVCSSRKPTLLEKVISRRIKEELSSNVAIKIQDRIYYI